MGKINKVMVIDDDEIDTLICSYNINASHIAHQVVTCRNARDGFENLSGSVGSEGDLPDLIFLDINMPVMNGWEFLEKYKAIASSFNKKIVLFMLSSSILEEDMSKARSYGEVTDYLTKPLSIEKLKNIKETYFR